MTNTGLILSESIDDDNDGIFTALEASLMNLDGTKLVILSACETGLGEVENGEGVYGLQRAINIAGAENALMSSWKVDDTATKDFMESFYENYFTTKKVVDAYKSAMNELEVSYTYPYYWGAFVLLK